MLSSVSFANGVPSWSWAYLKGANYFAKIPELSHTNPTGLSFDQNDPASVGQFTNASIKLESSIMSTTVWVEDEGRIYFPQRTKTSRSLSISLADGDFRKLDWAVQSQFSYYIAAIPSARALVMLLKKCPRENLRGWELSH
jgi:hypothetical protein